MNEKKIADAKALQEVIASLAQQLADQLGPGLCLVGVYTRGAHLAKRLAALLSKRFNAHIDVGGLDINLYRDDLSSRDEQPVVGPSKLTFPIEGRCVVLVDDVLFTGRSTRCALDALLDYGRPEKVLFAALVDRGHRELPICADFVGMKVTTTKDQEVILRVSEVDGKDEVVVRGS